MTKSHSNECGGSSAERRLNCYASRSLEAECPSTSSEYAERGSMLHAAMEMVLMNWPENMKQAQPLVTQLIGQNFDYDSEPITEEDIAVKIGPALTTWFAIVKKYKIVDWWLETQVSLETEIEGAFGTADVIAIDKQNRLHILDWKFGDGVIVRAEANYSLAFYACAAFYDPDEEMREFTAPAYDEAREVFFHIVQPVENSTSADHDVWQTTVGWCEDFLDQLVDAMNASRQPDPQPTAGYWCRWCSAKIICPAQKQLVLTSDKKQPDLMDAVELGALLNQLKVVEAFSNDAFAYAQQQLEAGVTIPGWKLVQKRATRQWIDPAEVEKVCKASRVKVDVMYEKELRSPAQLEKRAKRIYAKKLADLVHSQSSGLAIAPASDKRPAVTGSTTALALALEKTKPET